MLIPNKKLIVLIVFLISAISAFSCSSFVIYLDSANVLYGMNFDYPETELKFEIQTRDSLKIFHLCFLRNGHYCSTVGMNSEGFFASCQMLFPIVKDYATAGANDITVGNMYYTSLFECSRVPVLLDVFQSSNNKLIHNYGLTLHNLFADQFGNAAIVEVGDEEPKITYMKDRFLVMTNFSNSRFANEPYADVRGVGANRYKIATQTIIDHYEHFDQEHGLDILKKTAQEHGDFKTLCSLLFDPISLEIMITIHRDFEKIWKINLQNETIESFRGLDREIILDIPEDGILASELEKYLD